MSTYFKLALISILESAWGQCARNWLFHGGSCYHFSRDLETWPEAYFVCKIYGAHLIEINSGTEDAFLRNNSKDREFWIGLSDLQVEGEWLWVASNTRLSYQHWQPSEPNNEGGLEHCASAVQYGWNDLPCNSQLYYVCEKEFRYRHVILPD